MVFKNKPHFQRLSWCCTFLLAIFCVFTFAVDLYFNFAIAYPHLAMHSYGDSTPRQIINKHMTQITPELWILWIWHILYGILGLWFLYVFYLLMFREFCSRDNKSSLFSALFWFLFSVVNVLNALWLYLFVNNNMLISGIILLILTFMLTILSTMVCYACWMDVACNKDSENDVECDDKVQLSCCEIIILRMLTLNCLPFYTIWCAAIACFQWTVIFKYFLLHWSDNVSSIICLSVLSAVLVIYWATELLFKREYFVWTWLPAFSLIILFSGVIARNHSIGGINAPGVFFVFILLIVTGVVIVLKLASLCFCRPKSPERRFSRI